MNLKGSRITLRETEPEDVDVILNWENNPEHWLVSNTVEPFSREEILDFIVSENDLINAKQTRLMAVNENNEAVGCIDLFDFDKKHRRAGLGVLIDAQYRGLGYAKEMLNLALDYCLGELDLNSVYAEVLESNEASIKLFEHAGFELSGIKKQWMWDGKQFQNQRMYQLLR